MDNKDLRSAIEKKMADCLREIISLTNEREEMSKRHDRVTDEIFVEFLTVIDAFEKAEKIIKEKGFDADENASKAIKRLLNAKKKAIQVLDKFNVKKIEFVDNMAIDDKCTTIDTEPDASRKNGEIISVEKEGYTRDGHVLRTAEVITVRN